MSTIHLSIETVLTEMLEGWERERYTMPLDMRVRSLGNLFEEWYDDALEEFRLQVPGDSEE